MGVEGRGQRTGLRAVGGGRRRVLARPVLPGGRALVGGLLLTVSSVATFAAWRSASATPDHAYVVARHPLAPGARLTAADLEIVRLDLPGSVAGGAFDDVGAVVDRVTLGPVGEGELVQASQLSDTASAAALVEVSFAVPRDRALDGRLRSGDRVDVFVTYDDYTAAVVEGAEVVAVGDTSATLGAGGDLTVTLALDAAGRRAELVHAVRAGEVTLVRSTQAAQRPPSPGVVHTPSAPTPVPDDDEFTTAPPAQLDPAQGGPAPSDESTGESADESTGASPAGPVDGEG